MKDAKMNGSLYYSSEKLSEEDKNKYKDLARRLGKR